MTRLARPAAALLTLLIALLGLPASASASSDVHPWLLTVSDMPVGWATYPLSNSVAQGCWSPVQDLLARQPGSWGGANYEYFDGSAFATEVLFSWPSSGDAQKAWAGTNALLSSCHEFLSSTGLDTQIDRLNLGRFGNASAAWFATDQIGWGFVVLLARKGPVVAMLVYTVPVDDFALGTVLPFFGKALTKVPVVLAPKAVQPLILNAYPTPVVVGAAGGRVTLKARLRDAATCQLELLSRQDFAVVFASNTRPCRTTFTAHVTIGANTTAIERHVAFALVARNGAKSFTGRFWVGLARHRRTGVGGGKHGASR